MLDKFFCTRYIVKVFAHFVIDLMKYIDKQRNCLFCFRRHQKTLATLCVLWACDEHNFMIKLSEGGREGGAAPVCVCSLTILIITPSVTIAKYVASVMDFR